MFVVEHLGVGVPLPGDEVDQVASVFGVLLFLLVCSDGSELLKDILFDKVEGSAEQTENREQIVEGLNETTDVDVFPTTMLVSLPSPAYARIKRRYNTSYIHFWNMIIEITMHKSAKWAHIEIPTKYRLSRL